MKVLIAGILTMLLSISAVTLADIGAAEHSTTKRTVALPGVTVSVVNGPAADYIKAVEDNQVHDYLVALDEAQHRNSTPVVAHHGGGSSSGGTCAGSIPGNIIYRESKCDPRAVNSRSGAAGKYQVLASTWDGYGGYATADQAPEEVQDAWAAEAYAQAGCRPWGGC